MTEMTVHEHIERHRVASLPPRYRCRKLSDFSQAIQTRMLGFLDDSSWCCYIYGAVGTCKSSLAVATLQTWRDRQVGLRRAQGHFVPIYSLAEVLRNLAVSASTLDAWKQSPFLILDDLGASRSTPHIVERTCFLLEYRYDHSDGNAKTIVTSNLDLKHLAEALDPRLASRLQEGLILNMGRHDMRRAGTRRLVDAESVATDS